MRVAIMGRSLRGRFTGVVRYTDELVRALAARADTDVAVFVTRADDGLDGVRVERLRAPYPTPNEYLRALWEQSVVPRAVGRLRPDVYHSPNYILPLALRCPTVVTIHDLAFLDAGLHRLRSHIYLSVLTALSLRKATRVICVSESTRHDLVRFFPHAAEKARVIGEGVDGRFRPASIAEVTAFRARHALTAPYILFVGTIEPRKNLTRLIDAYGVMLDSTGAPHELVIAGQRGWKDGAVWEAHLASRHRHRIRALGYLPDDELAAAYTGADVFAYPSLYEGFGLPPLEAMACGAPVLTSRTSSLPGVVGDSALLVEPRDTAALAAGLARLVCDPTERVRLRAKGVERAAGFRWERVAERTVEVYAEAAAA
jgi:glycosyltransferase involved in cell wall biosynthesis